MGISQEQARKKAKYLSDREAIKVTRKVKEAPRRRNSSTRNLKRQDGFYNVPEVWLAEMSG